jgi:choline dehydrogenase-like flavoprotein
VTHSLTPAQRLALEHVCRRMVPAAFADAPDLAVSLPLVVEERLGGADPALLADVGRLLTILDHPLAGWLTLDRAGRFSALAPAEQEARLERWAASPLAPLRTAFQALRRLTLSSWYAEPAAQADVGYRGPLHLRAPAVPWEGGLAGREVDAEPVARGVRLERTAERGALPTGVVPGHHMPQETEIRAGVCVVGSGAGGAVAAARLAAAGFDVVVLEEGHWWSAAEFTEREHEMMPRLYAEAGLRSTADLAVTLLQGRAAGGGTTANWMLMLRTPDHVLEEWAREHGAEGLAPADLAPVFARIESEVHARTVPDDAHSAQNGVLLEGARRLGWRVQAARVNATSCIRAGFCGLGCRYEAKQGAQQTYLPQALADGARLLCDVRVLRVEGVERGGRAPLKRVHAEVLDRWTGRPRGRLTVEAPIVVLAGGAVGTPALLQRSGLGGGGVGRYLRLHPTTAVVGRYDREIYGAAGIPLSSVCDEFVQGDGDGYGFWVETAPLYPGLAAAAVPGFGAVHRELMREFPRLGALIVLVRDGADRDRSHGDVRVDRRGRVRIRYRLGDAEWAQLRRGLGAAARIHLAAGAEEALTLHHRPVRVRAESDLARLDGAPFGPNHLGLFSAHVNGTCRIGSDARTSGCGPDGRRHGVAGLYVADGSLLPTAPGVNPQETIMAVADVIARRIADAHHAG